MNVKTLCCVVFFSCTIASGVACQAIKQQITNHSATDSPSTLEVDIVPVESAQFEVKGIIKKVKKE